ncbi:DUF4255 domain-containing protein [Sorangium sp. So ce1024]|uniref:DUF4255 domain-containing protein n=1 Tax=unclassified Sorangium TaxID=2621164 RepID=UPI003F0D8CF7
MADARAIFETSRALQRLLQEELSVLPILASQIRVESLDLLPDPVPPPRITIFLFNLHENPYLMNQPPVTRARPAGRAEVVQPPLAIDLDYMICAWAATADEEQQLLGDVLRALNDSPALTAPQLGPAWEKDESVQLELVNPPIEEQVRLWSAFGFKRFKLALYYRASSVPIASRRTTHETLVRERHLTVEVK